LSCAVRNPLAFISVAASLKKKKKKNNNNNNKTNKQTIAT
jgi:hypothetical protein